MIWFEKYCNFASKIIPIKRSGFAKRYFKSKIDFCELLITPESVLSAIILTAILLVASNLLVNLLVRDMFFTVFFLFFSFFLLYYISFFLDDYAKYIRIRSEFDLILSVLYMVISLRLVPNLERALEFAGRNVGGAVGRYFRKIVWGLKIGKIKSGDEALDLITQRWGLENEEFRDSVETIRSSLYRGEEERDRIFKEALDMLFERNKERLKSYVSQLKHSISILTYLGFLLPIILSTLFPIITIFLAEAISSPMILSLFDIGLPIFIFLFLKKILSKRPFVLGRIQIEEHPEMVKPGYINIGRARLPLLPISLTIIAVSIYFFFVSYTNLPKDKVTLNHLISGLILVFGIICGIEILCIFSWYKNLKLKREIENTEKEFASALYILGIILKSGHSVESSLEKLIEKSKELKISSMFKEALHNMSRFGVTLEEALFNPKFGVIKKYPSRLIKNVMKVIVESLRKGPLLASKALTAISDYLKHFFEVEIFLKDSLEEVLSEMRMMVDLLLPIAIGVTIGISAISLAIIFRISEAFRTIEMVETEVPFSVSGGFSIMFVSMEKVLPVEVFVVALGIYLIQTTFLISYFYSSIIHGGDLNELLKLFSITLLRNFVIFSILSLLIFMGLGGMIESLAI